MCLVNSDPDLIICGFIAFSLPNISQMEISGQPIQSKYRFIGAKIIRTYRIIGLILKMINGLIKNITGIIPEGRWE
jgi:hypothetical protein